MSRRDEIWRLNQLSAEEITATAPDRLHLVPDLDALNKHLARSIADTVREKPNAVLILPCGHVAMYSLLRDIINRKQISLKETRLFFMHEYADAAGSILPTFHPLNSRTGMAWLWEQLNLGLGPAEESIVFPDQFNIEELPSLIKKAGGVDVCFGYVGIHGEIGFNGPEAGVRDASCRLVRLNDFTVAISALCSEVGGDIENFPRHAFTLGLRECLSARRIRLYCRCDIPGQDWAQTVLRLAVLGQSGDDYPVTWVRTHPHWQLIADQKASEIPRHLL